MCLDKDVTASWAGSALTCSLMPLPPDLWLLCGIPLWCAAEAVIDGAARSDESSTVAVRRPWRCGQRQPRVECATRHWPGPNQSGRPARRRPIEHCYPAHCPVVAARVAPATDPDRAEQRQRPDGGLHEWQPGHLLSVGHPDSSDQHAGQYRSRDGNPYLLATTGPDRSANRCRPPPHNWPPSRPPGQLATRPTAARRKARVEAGGVRMKPVSIPSGYRLACVIAESTTKEG